MTTALVGAASVVVGAGLSTVATLLGSAQSRKAAAEQWAADRQEREQARDDDRREREQLRAEEREEREHSRQLERAQELQDLWAMRRLEAYAAVVAELDALEASYDRASIADDMDERASLALAIDRVPLRRAVAVVQLVGSPQSAEALEEVATVGTYSDSALHIEIVWRNNVLGGGVGVREPIFGFHLRRARAAFVKAVRPELGVDVPPAPSA